MQSDAGQSQDPREALRSLVQGLSPQVASRVSAQSLVSVVQEKMEPEESADGDLAELRVDLAKYGSEYDSWKLEIEKKIAAIRQEWGPWPSAKQYLLNRLEYLVPDTAKWLARMKDLSERAESSASARKRLAGNLTAYSKGGDGRQLLEKTRADLNSMNYAYMDGVLISKERDDTTQIRASDEAFFQNYLLQGKPGISVYRGDGRGVNANSLNGFAFQDVLAGGTPDITFAGVVEHTHTSSLKNGMVSTTTDQAQAIAWAVDDHKFGLVYELRPVNYIHVANLLRARNFKNRFAAQLEILIPGNLPAAQVFAVSLYRQAGKTLVQRIQQ